MRKFEAWRGTLGILRYCSDMHLLLQKDSFYVVSTYATCRLCLFNPYIHVLSLPTVSIHAYAVCCPFKVGGMTPETTEI